MKKLLIFAFFSFALLGASVGEVVVNAVDIRPFCFEENGKPSGIAVEILDEIGKETGIDFRYRFLPWIRAQLETQVAKDAMIIPLTRAAERERDYEWIAPLFKYQFMIVTKDNVHPIGSLDDLQSLTVGVLRGNPMESRLRQMGLPNIRPGKSEEEVARLLKADLIDAWVVADLVAKETYRRAGGAPAELRFRLKIGEPMWAYAGASRGFSMHDKRRISDAAALLHSNMTIDRIIDKYRLRQ